MGLYNADIAGLFGGIGGGIPLFPIDVEEDEEALAYVDKMKLMNILTLQFCFLLIIQVHSMLKDTFNDDEDTDNFPIPTPPLLITLCIIDDDPPLVPVYKNKVSMIIADIYIILLCNKGD